MWEDRLSNEKFRSRVLELMDEHIIQGFKNKTGDAKNYYNIDGEEQGKVEAVV